MDVDSPQLTSGPRAWIPPGEGVNWSSIGQHGWHVISLLTWLGNRVLAELGEGGGAVIQDDLVHTMTWLIPLGSAEGRALPPEADTTGDEGKIFVPGMARTRTTYWRLKPNAQRLLTDCARLLAALEAVQNNVRPGRPAS
ncbi:hypothetical protein [Streptomyces buecherae]|uniref:hypothetical protein n=1 Tax=Streptomyces buecherae TaxID=2763006 RepID=UPI001C26F070|nr:hypothetical protein [Streptomyces buecherae]